MEKGFLQEIYGNMHRIGFTVKLHPDLKTHFYLRGVVYVDTVVDHRRGKAVLMTTNQLQYCKAADEIIIMEEGKVAHRGSFQEVSW